MMLLSTLTVRQDTASLSLLAPNVILASTVSALSRTANGAHPSKPKRKLCEQTSNRYRSMSPFTRCESIQIVCQHSNAYNRCIHPSKLPTPKKTRFLTLASLSDGGCHLTFTWCSSHSGIRGNELAEVADKEGTIVEQEGVSHHYDSLTITHERLCRIYCEGGEKVNHDLESLQL